MNLTKKALLVVLLFVVQTTIGQQTMQNLDSALTQLRKMPDDTAKVVLLQKIGGHYNVTHLDSAKAFLEEGLALAETLNFDKGKWINYNTLGVYHERKTQYDSAMYYLDKALEIVEKNQSTKGFAVVLNNIATVEIRKGDFEKALENMFEALRAEEELGNKNGIAQAYNNIGVIYYRTGNFDKTTEYLTKGLEIQEELGNLDGLQNGYNNVGAIFDYQQKYDEAIASYTKALEISRTLKDRAQEASFLNNIALSYTNKGDFTTAEQKFEESIAIREDIGDLRGKAFSFMSFGNMYLNQGNYPKANTYLSEALEISETHGLKLPKKESYRALSELAEKQNKMGLANEYLRKFIAVSDSIMNEDNARILAETEAKYETEKKEKEILAQRAQLAEKDLEVRKKNTLMYGGFGLALLLALLGYLVYNQQKLKNRQLQKEGELKQALAKIETQNKLQEQRLRISRDLHDNIGSQLTFIISSLDNLKYGFSEMGDQLTEKVTGISSFTSNTIGELRDTIWAMNKNSISFEDLQGRISNLIDKARSADQSTAFSFNIGTGIEPEFSFPSVTGMNIFRVIQESVNNALKYANAEQVAVVVSRKDGLFLFEVKDDGQGFDTNIPEVGNGLNNMRKRIRDISGELTITSEPGSGTTVSFSVPPQ